jgi:hypothetical protein
MIKNLSKFFFLLSLFFGLAFNANHAQETTKVKDVEDMKIPEYWDHFTIMVWQLGHNAKAKKELYEKVNLNSFHIDRSSKELADFSKENKWPFYVDHTADKGYLYLSGKKGKLNFASGELQVRPNSLVDPVAIGEMKDYIKKNINVVKHAYPLAYALDDEISTASFCTPVEVDVHPIALQQYRAYLTEIYQNDIKKLNAQYESDFKTFGEIYPKTFNDYLTQVTPTGFGKMNLSHWADWRSYMDNYFADCLKDLTHYANSIDQRPCGFVGGQGPTAFGGYDWRKLSKSVQWVEAYESGGNNEIIRSFWGQKRPLLKTFFTGKEYSDQKVWFLWYYLCHGNRGVIVWPSEMFNADKTDVTEGYKKMAPTFKEVQGDVSKLIIDSEFQYDKVAIYYSQPSIQVTWCMDSVSHGKTWPNRKSSIDNNLSTSQLTRMGWSKALEDIGIQSKFIHLDHLLNGELEKQGFKVLILNRVLALSDAEAAKITEFVKKGGTVIADHLCGIFDEHGKSRSVGALDSLFGVTRDLSKGILNGKTATEVDAEIDYGNLSDKNWMGLEAPKYLDVAVFELGLKATTGKALSSVSGTDVVVKNIVEKGNAIYLNLSTIGFYKVRGKGQGKSFTTFLKSLLAEYDVVPKIELLENGKSPYLLESIFWKKEKKNILCIFRNLSQGSSITGDEVVEGNLGIQNIKVTINLKAPVKNFKNERTQKSYGDGQKFEVEFMPYEAGIFSFD